MHDRLVQRILQDALLSAPKRDDVGCQLLGTGDKF